MRNLVAAVVAASLVASSALADSHATPLTAGKPAGVKKAQDNDNNTVWYIVGLGVVAAGIAIVASGNSNGNLAPGSLTTTTTTTTTTAT